MKRSHILVIRFSALGDVAMVVPVVHAVACRYPDVRITVLSREFAHTFFDDLAPNVNFMSADLKNEYRGIKGLNSLYRRLVAKQFTHVADLHSVLRSEYLRLRFNLGRFNVAHIDKHRSMRRQLVAREGHKVLQQLPTPFENYAEVFARLGFPVEEFSFKSIFADSTADGRGNLNLLPKAIGPKRSWEHWIGIAPFAAHAGKVYPTEKMEQAIALLLERHPRSHVFLFGRGKGEEAVFSRWTARFPQCLYAGAHTENMHQELILMSHLDVMVSMDSANQHLASLTATPVVSIWGATHPLAGFAGWHQKAENIVQADLPCRPCSIYGQKPCLRGDYACMTTISPETVVQAVERLLKDADEAVVESD